jgi:ligand-binding sensor domain-containing protein/anti-sigma regulatory factor (Ser/Thr protein kinase)
MGVSKFDGYKFVNFTKENGLPDNTIIGIYEDFKSRIWVWTLAGELAYFENNSFKSLNKTNIELKKVVKGGIITDLYVDKKNTIYLSGYNIYYKIKINILNNSQQIKTQLLNHCALFINSIPNDKDKYTLNYRTFAVNKNDVERAKNEKHIYFNKKNIKLYGNDISRNPHHKLLKTKNHLYISVNNLLVEILKNGSIKTIKSFKNDIIFLKEDALKNIWVGTLNTGVYKFIQGDLSQSGVQFLNGKSVSSIEIDHENGLWLSTLETGIFYIPNPSFYYYSLKSGLLDQNIKSIYLSKKNDIWLGTYLGNLTQINHKKISNLPYFKLGTANSIADINEKNNVLYVSSNNLYQIALKKYNVINELKIRSQQVLFSKNKRDVWAAGNLKLFNISDNSIKRYWCDFKINSISEKDSNTLYIGGNNGLYTYSNGKINSQNIRFKNRINELVYKNGILALATKGHGCVIFYKHKKYILDKKKGLCSNFCNSICLSKSKLWIGTNQGISQINLAKLGKGKLSIINLNSGNGLISNMVNKIKFKNDTIYLATNKGLQVIANNKYLINKIKPPVYIDEIRCNNKIQILKPNYRFVYNQNNIFIHFVGLAYKCHSNVYYKYRLKGLSTAWEYSKSPSTNYRSLTHGNYSFEVLARNDAGEWSASPSVINFEIVPPFWELWWFKSILLIIFIFLIYLMIRFFVRKAEKRAAIKTEFFKKEAAIEKEKTQLYEKAVEMEMKFLSGQMNPHFTFNAMNSIQHYMLNNEPIKAQQYLSKYSKLIRLVLENNMHKYVLLHDEIDLMELYMEIESMRFKNKFTFNIILTEELEEENVEIPPMIIQPYIENAIWHGLFHKKTSGHIEIKFQKELNTIICSIEDNGVGRLFAKQNKLNQKEHNSVGMLITQQRLQHLHADSTLNIQTEITDVLDTDGTIAGTKVVVILPIYTPKVQ